MIANKQIVDINAIKARKARLGYVETKPIIPVDLVRPRQVEVSIKNTEPEPETKIEDIYFRSEVLPPTEVKFKPSLIRLTHPRMDDIITAVAYDFQISPHSITSALRSGNVVNPRHIVCYLARELTNYSLPVIGRHLGGRDHSTVLNSYKKGLKLIVDDETMRARVNNIIRTIREGLGL